MKQAQLVLFRGEKFESQGLGLFAKDILRPGEWIHPSTGQRVFFDDERVQRLAESTNCYIRAGNVVRFPDGHSFRATDNLGDWPGPFIVHKGRLVGVVNAKSPKAAEGMAAGAIDAVSAFIEFDVKDSKGNHYPEVITHVCATPYPVIPGQNEFMKLSAVEGDSGNQDVFLLVPEDLAPAGKGAAVDPRKMLLEALKAGGIALSALGLKDDATVEAIAEALAKRAGAPPPGAGDPQALAALRKQVNEALAGRGLVLGEDGRIAEAAKPVAGDDPEKRALRARLEQVELDRTKERLSRADTETEQYVKDGTLPPALREDLHLVLSIAHAGTPKALALSADGTQLVEKAANLHQAVTRILGHVREQFGKAQRLSQFVPVSSEKAKEREEGKKKAVSLAREVQGIKDEK